MIDKVIDQQPRDDEQSNAPVKKKHSQGHHRCGEDALRDKHHHTGGHTGKVIHGVCCDGCNSTQTVFIKITHRQILKVLGNLYALVRRGTVAAIRLQSGGAVFQER